MIWHGTAALRAVAGDCCKCAAACLREDTFENTWDTFENTWDTFENTWDTFENTWDTFENTWDTFENTWFSEAAAYDKCDF
jgi:hypothetical protein